jgi:P27 family predicted phage terminase small subunit
MGLRGPAPEPTALRDLKGNPGHRPLPADEPKPEVGEPPRPRHLSPVARGAWTRLVPLLLELRVLTVADGFALEAICEAYAMWRKAQSVLTKEGFSYEIQVTTKQGSTYTQIVPRPEVKIAAEAWRRCLTGLQQFGLTPSARTRVRAIPAKATQDPLAALAELAAAARRGA